MSNTYTGTVINSPSFTSRPAQAFPEDIQGTVVELDSLPGGVSVDNIFYYDSPNATKYLKRVIDGTYRAVWAGIFPGNSGSVNATRLAAVCAKAEIKEIIFDDPAGGDYQLADPVAVTIDGDGKTLSFRPGCRITSDGTATLDNFIIKADMRQSIFDLDIKFAGYDTSTGTCRPADGRWSVCWFGALLDGLTDDSPAFQRTSDVACRNFDPLVYVPGGRAIVNNWFLGKDIDADGNYNFITITIEGAIPMFAPHEAAAEASILKVNDADAFGIGIQAGRMVVIRNLAIVGETLNVPTPVPQNSVTWTDDNWHTGSIRANRYSPHAGIVIDPCHEDVATDDRYPGITDRYTNGPDENGNEVGTSMVTIENCSISHFECGIMVSPNGHTRNCDNIIMRGGKGENCRSFWASGQDQSRANVIEQVYFIGGIKFLVNCVEYGSTNGSAPRVSKCNIAGGTKYLYNIAGGFEGISFDGCYAESVWSLGKAGFVPVNFTSGCNINFMRPDEATTAPGLPVAMAEGTKLNFTDSTLQFFANGVKFPMQFAITGDLSFRGCYINGGLPTMTYDRQQLTSYIDSTLASFGVSYAEAKQGKLRSIPDYLNGRPMLAGNVFEAIDRGQNTWESLEGNCDFVYTESINSFTVDNTAKTLTFTSAVASRYQVGDQITTAGFLDDPEEFYSNRIVNIALGYVFDIDGNDIICKGYPMKITADPALFPLDLFIVRVPNFIDRTLGTTDGTNTINTIIKNKSDLTFKIGSWIFGEGIPTGTRVAGFTMGGDLIMTQDATASLANVELSSTRVKQTFRRFSVDYADDPTNLDGLLFFRGDEVINTFTEPATRHIAKWVCVSQGKINASPSPDPELKPYYIGPDEFSLTTDGTRKVFVKTLVTAIAIKPSSNLDSFKVGTTLGDDDIIPDQPVTASGWITFPLDVYFENSTTLYFGIDFTTSGTVEILIYEQ